ncbi:hypothetical protein SH2C18_20350 [Clostridium sediminicola]
MKKLFHINKRPIIDFLNAIYKDNISYSAKIEYGDQEITTTKYNNNSNCEELLIIQKEFVINLIPYHSTFYKETFSVYLNL